MPHQLRVMTYNIRLGIQEGLYAISQVIDEADADVVALQEVGHHWTMGPSGDSTARLSALTGLEHHIFIPAIIEDRPGQEPARYGQALLSRWPILEVQVDPLPQIRDEPRRLARVLIDSPAGAVEIFCTHLSYLEEDRPQQGQVLRERICAAPLCGADDAPVARFIMGDFNEPERAEWLEALVAVCDDPGAPEAIETFPAHQPDRRIDFVLGQGARALAHRVLENATASDHLGVLTLWEV
ncbi:endonuclease/exonuclease/phosphatase family protein [Lujinxingia sediminis]|nr:endonuclease/exonuclease/phosphatase family protein [Lujinxingia sediminis]